MSKQSDNRTAEARADSLQQVVGRASSNRKPHNGDAGYIAEKIFRPTGAHVVIYIAESQGIDVDGNRYAVVCSKHSTICGVQSVPKARVLMKYPEFCERCMAEQRSTPNAGHQILSEAK